VKNYDISVNSDSVRREELEGQDHLVVPVKAVEEGVLDGGFLAANVIEESEPGWNGVPVVAGHPTNGSPDAFISANQPEVQENLTFGRFFDADANDGEMTGELWLDIEKAERLSDEQGFDVAATAIEKLDAGEDVAVSTSYIPTERVEDPGRYDGQAYQHVLESIQPDHIGVLPDGQGRDPSARTLVANSMRSITNTLGTVLTNSESDAEGEAAADQESMPEDLTLDEHVAPFLASAIGVSEEEGANFVNAMNPDADGNLAALTTLIESSEAVELDALHDELAPEDGGEQSGDGGEDGASEGEAAANQGTDFSARVAANQSRDDTESMPDFGSYSTRQNDN